MTTNQLACCDRTDWALGGRIGPKPYAPPDTYLCDGCWRRLKAAGWQLDPKIAYRVSDD